MEEVSEFARRAIASTRIIGAFFMGKALEAMSAANFIQTELSDANPREPSMEEILASIRRIIAEDQALFAANDASRANFGAPQTGGSDAVDAVEAPVPGGRLDVEAEACEQVAETARQRGDERAPDADASDGPKERLVSASTDATVAKAFETLVAARFAQNSEAILAMTRNALRPLLEAWLDAHLPALVERLIRAEIERMSKG